MEGLHWTRTPLVVLGERWPKNVLPGEWVQAKLNQTLFPEGVFGPTQFKIDVTFGRSPENNDHIHGFVRGYHITGNVANLHHYLLFTIKSTNHGY